MPEPRPTRRALLGGAAAAAAASAVRCAPPRGARRRVPAYCRICNATCGIELVLDGDRFLGVQGRRESHTRGFVCGNGLSLPELVASPRRVTRPLVRRGGELRPATWDEALDRIAEGLAAVRRAQGPRAVAVQAGWGLVYRNVAAWLKRLCDALETPNYISSSSICIGGSRLAYEVTYGHTATADLQRTHLALLWGSNPMCSFPTLAQLLLSRRSRGMKLLVVDPFRTRMASQADLHLALRPGTDLALALGLLGEVLREGLVEREAVEATTVGLDELAEAALPATPEWVAGRTGLEADLVRRAAAEIAAAESACGYTGVAVEQSGSGFQTCRAFDALWALTGNVDRPGGKQVMRGTGTEAELAARGLPPAPPGSEEEPVGARSHPLYAQILGEAQGNLLPAAVLRDDPYPVRALFVMGANPALSSPGSREVRQALETLDLLVVADPVLSETAELAHVVLPSATFLEADDAITIGDIGEVEAALAPRGEAWPDWKIVFEVARRADLGSYFPWETGQEARAAQHMAFARTRLPPRGTYATPSGRIELASSRLRDLGLPAVPRVADEPGRDAADDALTLVTGPRRPAFCNSQLRGVLLLEQRVGGHRAEVGRETARGLGLETGDDAALETSFGRLAVTVAVDPSMPRGLVRLPHCVAEANANVLTSMEDRDPVSGFPNLRALPCRLVPSRARSGA